MSPPDPYERSTVRRLLIPSCIHAAIEDLEMQTPSPPAPLPKGEGGQRPGEGIARLGPYRPNTCMSRVWMRRTRSTCPFAGKRS